MIGALIARKAIADAFEHLNRHDLSSFMSAWRDDGVFVYPGEISMSGTFEGRTAVENWFAKFLEQFPKIHFDVHDICVRNIGALTGNNVIAAHWTVHLTNRTGRVGQTSGVTVITAEGGKVRRVKDFIFDLGENFKLNWGEA